MTWRNGMLAVFGAWFVVSPWVVGPAGAAYTWSAVVLGGLTLRGAVAGMLRQRVPTGALYLMALFGLYLGLTPYFYGLTQRTPLLWLSMLVGAAILVAALGEARGRHAPDSEHRRAA